MSPFDGYVEARMVSPQITQGPVMSAKPRDVSQLTLNVRIVIQNFQIQNLLANIWKASIKLKKVI